MVNFWEIKKLQDFLETDEYYLQYNPEFTTVAYPLHKLMTKSETWR